MGGVSSETCWASYKYEIKFWYTLASCWIFYVKHILSLCILRIISILSLSRLKNAWYLYCIEMLSARNKLFILQILVTRSSGFYWFPYTLFTTWSTQKMTSECHKYAADAAHVTHFRYKFCVHVLLLCWLLRQLYIPRPLIEHVCVRVPFPCRYCSYE